MRNVAFVILATLVLLGPLVACDETKLSGINVGSIDFGIDASDLITGAFEPCDASDCDGDLNDAEVRGPADADAYALMEVVFWTIFDAYTFEDIFSSDAYNDIVPSIPDDVERVLTFRANDSVPCDDGSIELSGTFTGVFDNNGLLMDDIQETLSILYLNCVLAGNFLDNGNEETVVLNGSLSYLYHSPLEPSAANPYRESVTGTVLLDTEVTSVEASRGAGLGEAFWTDVVRFHATATYDGDDSTDNGGACAGEVIAFGPDSTTDADDDCFDDEDADDAFFDAGAVLD